jgi:hypothetical protein
MRNVRERMSVLYGEDAQVEIVSRPGRGTKVRLLMPLTHLEAGEDLLTVLAATVRSSLETVEAQRSRLNRFAKIGSVGRRDG